MVLVGRRNRHNEPKAGGNRRAKIAARAAEREELSVEPRPFAGFAGECDVVAMREFVPSATARTGICASSDGLVIASPNNPTGAVATREKLEGFQRLCVGNGHVLGQAGVGAV